MNRWLIAYKDSGGKWRAFCYVSNRALIGKKIEKLFEMRPEITQIQIVKEQK